MSETPPISWAARIGKIACHGASVALYMTAAYYVGYHNGSDEGQRRGVDAVMCTMDRLANGKPVGALGKSDFCQRIYKQERGHAD